MIYIKAILQGETARLHLAHFKYILEMRSKEEHLSKVGQINDLQNSLE